MTPQGATGPDLLSLRDVSVVIDGLQVLREVNLKVRTGEIVGIWGGNGAGKSTLLKVIAGWRRPTSGSVFLLGESVSRWPAHRHFALGLREVPQHPSQSPELLGREILALADRASRTSSGPSTGPQDIARLVAASDLERRVSEMSFASRKLLAIAAAVRSVPKMLLLDEPTVGLQPDQMARLQAVLREDLPGVPKLIVEHNESFLASTCTRIVELRSGQLDAAPEAVRWP